MGVTRSTAARPGRAGLWGVAGRTATRLPPGSRAVCGGRGRGPRRPVRTCRMRVRSRLAPRAPDEHRLPSAGHRARRRGARQKPALGHGLGLEPSCWSGPRTPWAVPVTRTKLRRPGSRCAECCRGLRGVLNGQSLALPCAALAVVLPRGGRGWRRGAVCAGSRLRGAARRSGPSCAIIVCEGHGRTGPGPIAAQRWRC